MPIYDRDIEKSKNKNLIHILKVASQLASIGVISIGSIVMLGWMFKIAALKSVLPGLVTMKANTAANFIFSGVTLWLWHQRVKTKRVIGKRKKLILNFISYLLPSLVVLISILTILEYILGRNLGIDELLFLDPTDIAGNSVPGRMSMNTSISFSLLGCALLLLVSRYTKYRPIHILTLTASLIALIGLLGYFYGVKSFYGISSYSQMGLHTAVAFIILCIGILFARPDSGLMAVVTSNNAGGLMARRLSLTVIGVPPVLGWLILAGYRDFYYDAEIAIALFGVLNIVVFAWVIWWNAKFLNTIDMRRVQAQKALLESERQFRAIFDRAFQLAAILTPDGTLIETNQTSLNFIGAKSENVLNRPFWETPWWTRSPQIQQQLKKAIAIAAQGQFVRYEVEIQRASGTLATVDFSLRSVKDETGQVVLLIPEARDITDSKQAEQALQQTSAALQQQAQRAELLNQLAGQIRQSLDLDTILETTVQEIRCLLQLDRCTFMWYLPDAQPPAWDVVHEAKNSELLPLLGYYPADVTGTLAQSLSKMEIYRVNDIAALPESAERQFFLSLGYSSLLDLPIQTRSGRVGVIACTQCGSLRSWTDDEVELLQAVCDQLAIAISQAELYIEARNSARIATEQATKLEQALQELQQTQTQLIHSEKMSSLGQMVAGIAHEINNPVNFIHGNMMHAQEYFQDLIDLLHLYQQTYPNPNPKIQTKIEEIDLDFLAEDLPKMLTSMKIGTKRISELVLSLRNFSRLDEAEFKDIDLHQGIDNTLLIISNRLKQGITLIKEYGNLPSIECYPAQLNQVFMNIINNAIDALNEHKKQENKQIVIKTQALSMNQLMVRISDNGPGIPPGIKAKIFDPFFTTKPVGKGTGLGLSLCYKIIEKHQGKIEVKSQIGVGTEFTIILPVKQSSSIAD